MSSAKKTTPYQKAYESLNENQRQAVNTIEGPVLVIAGPGTGKTQIIATRIAHILQNTDLDPSSILALTFTDSGVQAMRQRLLSLIGPTAYYVQIYTFHSFCSEVIRTNPEYFVISPDIQPLTDLDRYQIIDSIIDSHTYQHLKPVNAPNYYTKAIISSLQTLKREGITPTIFNNIVSQEESEYQSLLKLSQDKTKKITKTSLLQKDKLVNKNKELLDIYKHYQQALSKNARFDFEDMINFVIEAFTNNPDLLLSYQEKLQYFLVDEYQDTNSSQNQVINLLSNYWGPQANIFVVGDPCQSIYRFNGASFENMLSFVDTYKNAKVITLLENYRSTQTILDSSNKLISNNSSDNPLSKAAFVNLKSQNKTPEVSVKVAQFSNNFSEDYFLATSIKELIKKGVNPSQIAIIFRRNINAGQLSSVLARFGIPFQIQGGGDVLTDPHINQLVNVLKVLSTTLTKQEGSDLFVVLNYPFFNLNALDILRLSRAAATQKTSIIDILNSKEFPKNVALDDPDAFSSFLLLLADLQKQSLQLTLPEFLEHIIFKTGFLKYLESRPDSIQKLEILKSFLDFVFSLYRQKPNLTVNDLLAAIELMRTNHIQLTQPELTLSSNAVTLTTAHKAKGLEWQYCFVYQAVDGTWGNNISRNLIKLPPSIIKYDPKDDDSKLAQNEEERRLFYVALTRAKQQLCITYSNYYLSQSTKEAVPSMFISELPQELVSKIETHQFETESRNYFSTLLAPNVQEVSQQEQVFLKNIINNDFHLSATALTSYLDCAYRFKLKYLVKVPEAPHPAAAFGSAVHKALEIFYTKFQSDKAHPTLASLLDFFETSLRKQPLTQKDQQIRLMQGKDILTSYFNLHKETFSVPLYTEKWFGGHRPIFLDDISLVGKIDRIDPIDQNGKSVRLVDYKTGQVLSQNHIEGNTAIKDQTYKRQLVFYSLITSLDPTFRHHVEEVELDFVEAPHRESRLAHRSISITPHDLEEIKDLVRQTMTGIRNQSFPRTTDTNICQNCPFYDHCWPEGTPKVNPSQLGLFKS